MARPPKNAEGPSATERMETAFWDCLKEKPYSDIVVRDIVDRAKVNRNSYYYHYESMWDLAQASVQHAKFTDLARLLMSQKTFNPDNPVREFNDDAEHGFEMLQILSSENGNQRLLENAKEVITEEWLAMFGCENVLISKRTETEIDFVFGGITAMLANPNIATLEDLVRCIASSELLLETTKTMRQIIRACEPESMKKAVASLHPTHDVENVQEPSVSGSNSNTTSDADDDSDGANPAEKDEVEAIVDRIIEEELNSEHLREEEMVSDEASEQDPVNEEETQQTTEGNNEAVSTQDVQLESKHEDDLASEESIDALSSDDASQEDAAAAKYGQESVTSKVEITEIVVEETIEVAQVDEVIVEDKIEEETEEESTGFSAEESLPATEEQEEPAASSSANDSDEDDSQLSLDIFF